jgi:hypothetical protein
MAEIKICANDRTGIPMPHQAFIKKCNWDGGGTIDVLALALGYDVVEIWPIEAAHVYDLGRELVKIAKLIEEQLKG